MKYILGINRTKNHIAAGFNLILTFLICFTSLNASAQREAEIVKRLQTALRDGALDSPEMPVIGKGMFTMNNLSFRGTMYYHKQCMRMEFTFQDVTFIRLENDSLEWEYNPVENKHYIKKRSKEEYMHGKGKERILDFSSPELLNYKSLKNHLKFKGEQKIDSINSYVLELKIKDSNWPPVTFYINKKNDLIYKSELGADNRWFTNYKVIGNYVYPMQLAYKDEGTIMAVKLDEVTIGKSIPDSLFTVPTEAFSGAKEFDYKIGKLLSEADSLLNNGIYDASSAKYNAVLKLDGNNFLAYNGRGLSKVHMEKYYEAIADLNQAIEINEKSSQAYNNRGLAKYYLGDKKGALQDYTQALKLDTASVVAYKNRGLLQFQNGDYEEAEKDFYKALTLRPSDGDAHYKYAVSIAQLERYEEALESYKKAIELNAMTAEVYNYKGVTEFKLEMYQEAANSFKEAVAKNGDNLQYLENLGNAYYYSGDFDKALSEFEKYLEKDPKNAEMYNMKGLCKYREEDYRGAIKDFTKAIELNDKSAVYYANRASAKEEIEDYEGAIKDYTESISRNPTDASNFYSRGLAKIFASKKLEGCVDLVTAKDMNYESAKDAIMKHCN